MNSAQKMQEIRSFFVSLHPNLGNLNINMWDCRKRFGRILHPNSWLGG